MVFKTVLFVATRILEIITLAPIIGITGYFVHPYVKHDQDVPSRLLCLFIVSILACAWALITTFTFHRYRTTSMILILIDLAFMGALIASVVLLRAVAHTNCVSFNVPVSVTFGDNTYGNTSNSWVSGSRHCALQKAAWILAIIDIVLFAFTALLAFSIYRSFKREVVVVHQKESRRSGSSDYVTSGHHHHHHHRSHRNSRSSRV